MNKVCGLIKKKLHLFKNTEKEVLKQEVIQKNNEDSTRITSIDWNLINRITENDIVLVKMNEYEIKQYHIEEIHQKRPFVISKKVNDEQSICGYYLTSNISYKIFESEKNKGLKLVLNKNDYNLMKSSIIKFEKEIKLPFENIIRLLDHLNIRDLNRLKKYRNLLYSNPLVSNKENKLIEIGDIIFCDDKRYIIYQMDNTQCYGYLIVKTTETIDLEKDHNYIKFNKKIYFVDYKNSRVFNNQDSLHIVGRWNDGIVDTIRHNKKVLKYELNSSKNKK